MNDGAIIADDASSRLLVLASYPKTNGGTMRAENGGMLDVTVADFTNQGIAEATTGGLFRVVNVGNHYADGTLTGGTWRVYPSSTMRLLGAATDTLAATILLDGADSNLYSDAGTTGALAGFAANLEAGSFTIQNGRDFTTAGDLANAGRILVGDSSTLTLNGTLTQSTSGLLGGTGTVAGRLQGEYDRLAVTGQAVLAGRLYLDAIDAFEAADGDGFTVLTCGSRAGEFDPVVWGACPGIHVCVDQVIYNPTSVIVVVRATDPIGIEEPEPVLPEALRFAARWSTLGAAFLLDLPQSSAVRLGVFDVAGRQVALLRDGAETAGRRDRRAPHLCVGRPAGARRPDRERCLLRAGAGAIARRDRDQTGEVRDPEVTAVGRRGCGRGGRPRLAAAPPSPPGHRAS